MIADKIPFTDGYAPDQHAKLLGQGSQSQGPGTPSLWFLRMSPRWPLIDALLQKTEGMRSLKEKALPKWPKEPLDAYFYRLHRSTCHGFFSDAVDGLSRKPFEKTLTLSDDLPPGLEVLLSNASGEGASLEALACAWLSRAIAKGVAHVWVDYSAEVPAATLAEQRQAGNRPLLKLLDMSSVIAGKANEAGQITHLRIRDLEIYSEGYAERERPRIIEFNLQPGGGYVRTVWKVIKNGGDWEKIEEGEFSLPELPLATLNLGHLGRFEAEPPLQSLAEIEAAHFQQTSDHENNLASSVGGLFFAGASEDEVSKGIVLGPNTLNASRDPNAKLTFVEPTGACLERRAEWIARLESKMRELGARPMVEQAAARTATEVNSGDKRSQTVLQSWVRLLESRLVEALRFAAMWTGEALPVDFAVECYSDWNSTLAQAEHLRTLEAGRARKDIDRKTYLNELQRRGVLGESVNVQEVIELAEAEGELPDMPDLGDNPPPLGQPEPPQ